VSRTPGAEDQRWLAVAGRDARSAFIFGVTSTGFFCRPGCPAPIPSRTRVRFFADPKEARSAGFRPCRRCHPEAATQARGLLDRARELLDSAPAGRSTKWLAAEVGLSLSQLRRGFRAAFGLTPAEYARALKTGRARAALAGGAPVTEALYQAGFGSSRAFYELVPEALGMSPTEFRRGAAGIDIRYTIFDSALGSLLVATTERGICAVKMGSHQTELEEQLQTEFPGANLIRDDPTLSQVRSEVRRLAAGRAGGAELPLDVHGTVFQWQVWRQIQRIPSGQTKTYGQLASEIGRPSAARAVARACATNQVALVIPCHRVVPVGGGEGGYRWGKERKSRLLAAESEGG